MACHDSECGQHRQLLEQRVKSLERQMRAIASVTASHKTTVPISVALIVAGQPPSYRMIRALAKQVRRIEAAVEQRRRACAENEAYRNAQDAKRSATERLRIRYGFKLLLRRSIRDLFSSVSEGNVSPTAPAPLDTRLALPSFPVVDPPESF